MTAVPSEEVRRSADDADLSQLNRAYVRAVEERNPHWFDEHLARDFTNTYADGTFADRAEFIARVARDSGISNRRLLEVTIRRMGDFAIIHARTSANTSSGAEVLTRYTDIWARRDGRWVCVSAQLTRVA
jgi:ketosteroid isomerase-like protein